MEKIYSRKSNFELLRVLSMFFIVVAHCVYYSNFSFSNIGVNLIITKILRIGAKIGVNCFILISAYFMVNSDFKLKKVIKLELKILMYTIGTLIIALCTNKDNVSAVIILKSIFPISFSMYWFMTTYMILYFLSPFLNKFIKTVDEIYMKKLLLVLIFINVIIPTFTSSDMELSNLSWFITLYFIGGFIRTYDKLEFNNIKLHTYILLGGIIFIIITIIAISLLAIKIPKLLQHTNYFSVMNRIPLVLSSISLFYLFKNINIQNEIINKIILNISKNTLGIYLIHENEILRDIIWKKIFPVGLCSETLMLVTITILFCTCLFMICIFIDKINDFCVEKIYIVLEKISGKISKKIKLNKIKEVLQI